MNLEHHDFSRLNPFKRKEKNVVNDVFSELKKEAKKHQQEGLPWYKKLSGYTWMYMVTFAIWFLLVLINFGMLLSGAEVSGVKFTLDFICAICWGTVLAINLNNDIG